MYDNVISVGSSHALLSSGEGEVDPGDASASVGISDTSERSSVGRRRPPRLDSVCFGVLAAH